MADRVIENLITKLSFKYDKGQLEKFDKGITSAVKGLTAVVAGATAAAVAIFGFTKKISEANDELGKFSQRTGIDIRALQELGYVAELNGGSIDSMNSSLENLSRIASEAARGVGSGIEAFGILGISVTDAEGRVRSADDLLNSISDSISRLGSQAEKLELAQKLGINSDLLLAIENGSQALNQQRKEAQQLGFIIGTEDAKAAADFNDELLRIKKIFSGATLGASLSRQITPLLKTFVEWYKVNKALIQQNISLFIEKAIYTLKILFNTVLRVAGAVNTIVQAIGGWKVALAAATGAFIALNASALLMPILITAATVAILLLLEDIVKYAEGGDSAIGALADRFPILHTVLQGVIDLLGIVAEGWSLIFTQGDEAFEGLILLVKDVGAAIKDFLMKPINAVKDAFDKFADTKVIRLIIEGQQKINDFYQDLARSAGFSFDQNNVQRQQAPSNTSTVTNNNTTNRPNIKIEVNGGNPDEVKRVVNDVLNEQYSGAQTNFESQVDF